MFDDRSRLIEAFVRSHLTETVPDYDLKTVLAELRQLRAEVAELGRPMLVAMYAGDPDQGAPPVRTFDAWWGSPPVPGEFLEFVPYDANGMPAGPLQTWEVLPGGRRHLDPRDPDAPDGYGRHVVVLVRAAF